MVGLVAPLPVLDPLCRGSAVAVSAEVHVADPPVVADRARPRRAVLELARYAPPLGGARRAVDAAHAIGPALGFAHADVDCVVDAAAVPPLVIPRRAIAVVVAARIALIV